MFLGTPAENLETGEKQIGVSERGNGSLTRRGRSTLSCRRRQCMQLWTASPKAVIGLRRAGLVTAHSGRGGGGDLMDVEGDAAGDDVEEEFGGRKDEEKQKSGETGLEESPMAGVCA